MSYYICWVLPGSMIASLEKRELIASNAFYCFVTYHIQPYYCRPLWLSWVRPPTGDQEVVGFDPRRGRQHSFVEIDREIFSTIILSLPLIQEGLLSVSGERMCTILVNHLED